MHAARLQGTYQYLARIFFSCFWVLLGWMQVRVCMCACVHMHRRPGMAAVRRTNTAHSS